ncbi:hypothetical protein BGZ94_001315 [Podila epigama]|nr:hypothetical protein BGZ94_001315 [Podila epigama]
MLAGSGLCFLVGAHLIMVHMLANNHNSAYNRLAYAPPASIVTSTRSSPNLSPSTIVASTGLSSSLTQKPDDTLVSPQGSTDKDTMQSATTQVKSTGQVETGAGAGAGTGTSQKEDQTNFNAWIPSYLSGYLVNIQNNARIDQHPNQQATAQKTPVFEKRQEVPPLFKSLLPTHLLNPPTGMTETPGESFTGPHLEIVVEQDVASQQAASSVNVGALATSDLASSQELSPQSTKVTQDLHIPPQQPQLNSAPVVMPVIVSLLPQDQEESKKGVKEATNAAKKAGAAKAVKGSSSEKEDTIFVHSWSAAPGYNLAGLHLMLFIAANAFLVFLLATLFLGVLILTEFVLDREDDDLVQIKYLYWGRVIGIATATIVSAVHGSLLSGYVLLDGHSDWIAKAAVASIFFYWVSMTWLMGKITGPLPY